MSTPRANGAVNCGLFGLLVVCALPLAPSQSPQLDVDDLRAKIRKGLGWSINRDWNGHRVIWHSGAMPGSSATLWLVPAERIAIALWNVRLDRIGRQHVPAGVA